MPDERSGDAAGFLVYIYSERRMESCLLRDMLNPEKQPELWKQSGLPEDFRFSCRQIRDRETGVRGLCPVPQGAFSLTRDTDSPLRSGEYLVFHSRDGSRAVKLLFVAAEALRICYEKAALLPGTSCFIGRSDNNQVCFSLTDFLSRDHHALIQVDSSGSARLKDLKNTAAIYVNGSRVHEALLRFGDEIHIMGLSMVYLGDCLALRRLKIRCTLPPARVLPEKRASGDRGPRNYFVNPPRILWSLDSEEITVDPPPAPSDNAPPPLMLTLGPSLTMGAVTLASTGMTVMRALEGGEPGAVAASGIMAAGMLAGSLLWPGLMRRYQKKQGEKAEAYRRERYTAYIEDIDSQLAFRENRTMQVLNDILCPPPERLCTYLDGEKEKLHLWERSWEDPDFLDIRLGLGSRPFQVTLKLPAGGFTLREDPLRKLPDELGMKYGFLRNAPLTLNLRDNRSLGLMGKEENVARLLNQIILNIIALHPPAEVKLALITDRPRYFRACENLPHVWSNDRKTRFFASTCDEAHHIIHTITQEIGARQASGHPAPVPYYVILITDPDLTEQESFLTSLNGEKAPVTAVFACRDITSLPKSCRTIVQSDDNRTGYYMKNQNQNRFLEVTPDPLEPEQLQHFADRLMELPVKQDIKMLGITDRISFLQMYRCGNVEDLKIGSRWDSSNCARSLAAPIGVMAGGELFSLDIHESYHGCHGLVAGTTGSGKSEFLQEYILSLAVNYSPEDVAFVLVDFKGGDMARPFMEKSFMPALPHLAATISNLSGNILHRALVSLDAEIRARQRIFNQAAASLRIDKLDINSYQKYRKSGRLRKPLPHLIVIIDEFAQLKTQQPDFLEKLVNIAQVGRSLGIHLILATQKPSGMVDPQIQSNSRFRVCLKVADKQDSMEMLGTPDAAMIRNPGRLCLKVGYNEVYEQIQSGYSGADYVPEKQFYEDEEITVHMVDHTASPIHSAKMQQSAQSAHRSQLEAVVAGIVQLGQKRNLRASPLWLPPLPEKILLDSLDCRKHRGIATATLGLADLVERQQQLPLTLDLAETGNLALFGASGSGKTTFLQTLVYSMTAEYGYTPRELRLYAMDFAGRNLGNLSALPHTGQVIFGEEEEKIRSLRDLLEDTILERKTLFAQAGCSSMKEYRASSGKMLAAVLVLIDNYGALREKYMDLSDGFQELIAESSTFGVYFVITGTTRNSIHYRVMEHVGMTVSLCLNDPSGYQEILHMRPAVVPEPVSGRGIAVLEGRTVEFQTALACAGDTDSQRSENILSRYRELASRLEGPAEEQKRAERPRIPREAPYDTQYRHPRPEPVSRGEDTLILTRSLSGDLSYGISLESDLRVCICAEGPGPLQDRFTRLLPVMAETEGSRLLIIDDPEQSLKQAAGQIPGCSYASDPEALEQVLEGLKPELNRRLEKPEACRERLFIVISEFDRVFRMITDGQAELLRKICRYMNSPKYGIYFCCGFDLDRGKNNDALFLALVVRAENYLLAPGCWSRASMLIESLPGIPDLKPGAACLVQHEAYTETGW